MIRNIINLTWLPFALTCSYIIIYHTNIREALSYGCHESLFNPFIITYSFNHKNITHITFNILGLWYFAVYTIYAYGNIITAVVYTTSVIGAGAGYYIQCYLQHSESDIIGASGGIFGLVGFTLIVAMIQLVLRTQQIHGAELVLDIRKSTLYVLLEISQLLSVSLIIVIDMYVFLTSPVSTIAHVAHLGGFLCGVLLGCCVVTFDLCVIQT